MSRKSIFLFSFVSVLGLVSNVNGQIATDPLISRHFDFADYPEAYRYVERSGAETMKVFIDL